MTKDKDILKPCLFDMANTKQPRWPSETQRKACDEGLQDPLIQALFRPDRNCRECDAPYNFNHHEDCWTGVLENLCPNIISQLGCVKWTR